MPPILSPPSNLTVTPSPSLPTAVSAHILAMATTLIPRPHLRAVASFPPVYQHSNHGPGAGDFANAPRIFASTANPCHQQGTTRRYPGMIQVLDYSPIEGEKDAPITVHFALAGKPTQEIHLRLVIGSKAVETEVYPLPDGTYRAEAVAPALNRAGGRVPMAVQALGKDQREVVDSLIFGHFQYWETGQSLMSKWCGILTNASLHRRHFFRYPQAPQETSV